jgi:probable blue pigment (indigoidine) exporter
VGLAFLLAVRQLPSGSWWWRAALLSVLNVGAFFPLVFLAAYHLSSGLASTLTATAPFVVMALAWVLLSERPRGSSLLGALGGLVGVVVLVGGAGLRYDVLGLLASAGAITTSALGFVLVKRWAPKVGMLTLTAWQLVGGGLMLIPVALMAEGAPPALDLSAVLGYAYLGIIGTGLAFLVWFRAAGHLPAGSVALIGLLNPVTGTFLGVAFAGEAFGLSRAVGVGLILGGVLLGQVSTRRTARTVVATEIDAESATRPNGVRLSGGWEPAPCAGC